MLEWTRKWTINTVLEIFFLPNWMGESLKFLNTVVSSPWQGRTFIKDHAALVGQILGRGGPHAEEKVQLVEQEAQRPVHAHSRCGWWCANVVHRQLSTSSRPGSWLWTFIPVSQVFKSCFCLLPSPPNKHYMIVINTSLGEEQGFKIIFIKV